MRLALTTLIVSTWLVACSSGHMSDDFRTRAVNLRQLWSALSVYMSDHGSLPPDLQSLVPHYALSELITSPATGQPFVFNNSTTPGDLTRDTVLLYDHLHTDDDGSVGSNVLFGDGSVRWIAEDELKSLTK